MTDTLEIVEIGENGNTKHSPAPASNKVKQSNQLKSWFFTYNNYLETEIKVLCDKFNSICESYVFQKEIGEKGTPHLQGVIFLHKKARWSEFGLSNKINWSKTRNKDKAIEYCQKLDTSVGEIYSKGLPKPIKIIEKLRPFQLEIENIFLTEPDGRTLHWYYDLIGNVGKSSFCKYMFVKHNAITVQGGKAADLLNIVFNLDMNSISMIIIDIPRVNGNKISYNFLECVLNGMITNTKFETGVKVFNPPHIVVLSNEYPDTEKVSLDRWCIKEINNENFTTIHKSVY